MADATRRIRIKTGLRYLLSLAVGGVGVMHFVGPEPFLMIIPPGLPEPLLLVYISGVFEIAGAIGLQVPRFRRAAAWGLIALFVAVFPANIYQAIAEVQFNAAEPMDPVLLWARLPFQFLLIGWAWWYTRPEVGDAPA